MLEMHELSQSRVTLGRVVQHISDRWASSQLCGLCPLPFFVFSVCVVSARMVRTRVSVTNSSIIGDIDSTQLPLNSGYSLSTEQDCLDPFPGHPLSSAYSAGGLFQRDGTLHDTSSDYTTFSEAMNDQRVHSFTGGALALDAPRYVHFLFSHWLFCSVHTPLLAFGESAQRPTLLGSTRHTRA